MLKQAACASMPGMRGKVRLAFEISGFVDKGSYCRDVAGTTLVGSEYMKT
jgi:hypothetical protein